MFIPDPDLDFLPIPDPGVKKAPDPGSATLLRTLNKTEIVNYRIHRYEEKAFSMHSHREYPAPHSLIYLENNRSAK
jgi:hypothetical protein